MFQHLLATFDWAADVFVPLLLALTIGVLLSIYTGLVASRMFAFLQVRAKAVMWGVDIVGVLGSRYRTYGEFQNALIACSGVVAELASLGHYSASNLIHAEMDAYLRTAAAMCGVALDRNWQPKGDAFVPVGFNDRLLALHRERWERMQQIAAITPNYEAIVTPEPFPVYIGDPRHVGRSAFSGRRSDCGNCCENCNRTI